MATIEAGSSPLIVLSDRTITRSGRYHCATPAAALDVATIANAILFLDRQRDAGTRLAMVTASAPDAKDGDRVDHVANVLRQITKKLHNAGLEPRILQVNEEGGTGYHAHFVFQFPAARWRCLKALEAQHAIMCHDVPSIGDALTVKGVTNSAGLAGYLGKEACKGQSLGVGGDRVALNANLARALSAVGLYKPRPRRHVRYARRARLPPVGLSTINRPSAS